jgi:hypothetical protein
MGVPANPSSPARGSYKSERGAAAILSSLSLDRDGVVRALLALPLDEAHGSESPGAAFFVKPQFVDVADGNA